jgi:D-galactose 1-dehydrogenase
MKRRLRIAVIGFGKIARDQHLPAIARSDAFELVAVVDPQVRAAPVPAFASVEELVDAKLPLDAVALCQPPQVRYDAARQALEAGLAVLMEKPPCATVGEAQTLTELARCSRRALFAAWHSRFCPALPAARAALATRTVQFASIDWREDVAQWHPGQQWIGAPGGLGVFDAGINALSVVTQLLGSRLHVRDGHLYVPSNWATPITASLVLETSAGIRVEGNFDWLGPDTPEWVIRVVTDQGEVRVTHGGSRLWLDGVEQPLAPAQEYAGVYARFAELVERREVDVDLAPLQVVADSFLRSRRERVQPYVMDSTARRAGSLA